VGAGRLAFFAQQVGVAIEIDRRAVAGVRAAASAIGLSDASSLP
jgi:predicted RNA methylase